MSEESEFRRQLEDHIESTVEFVDDFSTNPGVTFSFEKWSPSPPPASPWYVFNNAGFHNVSTDRANHGSQSLHMGGTGVGDPSAVAVELDLSLDSAL